jgi:N-acylneuraminate cytidylyltransferase
MSLRPILAVIPARGGSKGLPGKNIRELAGLPLIAHTLECAARSPGIDRCIVSTDSEEIAAVVRRHGGAVPFLRPPELATDDAPMLLVIQHALHEMERMDGSRYGSLLLLDPTSPGRLPEDIARAIHQLEEDPLADGVVGVSEPEFNPYWHCVVEDAQGYARDLIPGAERFTRRQEVPQVYRINASLYLWRRDFLSQTDNWRHGRLRLLEIPDARAVHIDDIDGFNRAELLLQSGLLKLPWVESRAVAQPTSAFQPR